jgi:serine/threonine-protein kinase HipA
MLSINGKRKDITRQDLLTVARIMNIKKATTIISQISDIVNNWDAYAGELKVHAKIKAAIASTLLPL